MAGKPDSQMLALALLLETGLILDAWLLRQAAGLSMKVILSHRPYATKGQRMKISKQEVKS